VRQATRFLRPILLYLVLGWVPSPVHAQQPFSTDDADVTPRRKFHFEFSNEYDWLQAAAFPTLRQNTGSFELAYGLLPGVEVSIECPLIAIFNAPAAGPQRVFGIGDTNLSVKYNFYRERDGSRLPGMAVTANIEIPTGDANRQLGSGLSDITVNGILQKSITKRTKLRANTGLIFSGNGATGAIGLKLRGLAVTGGFSLVREFSPRLQLGAEVNGAVSVERGLGREQVHFLVGGNYLLREGLTFDFGVLGGTFIASPRVGVQLGISVDF
jgi:hypothetical protein